MYQYDRSTRYSVLGGWRSPYAIGAEGAWYWKE